MTNKVVYTKLFPFFPADELHVCGSEESFSEAPAT